MVVPEIKNVMDGLESTGGVRLHTHRRKLKQRFDIIKKLGQGTYGKVQLGVNKETGQEVAIKTIKKCKIETEGDLIRIRREIQIMSSLRHPYIIHIYEVFENKDKMVLVMEYAAGGELYDYLSERKVLQEEEARRIFRQISMAVYYCHKHQICHRDLKLENILLDEEGNAKIADFGLSNVFDATRLLSTFCGSPLYASPEIVKGIPYHGPEVDCWSLGVLLYTLVYGAMPFDGSNFKRLVRQISQGEYFEPKKSSNASKLIAGLLTVSGENRLDIRGVCEDKWLNEGEELSCAQMASEFSSQTPVRLDLLLALAPQPLPPQPQEGEEPPPILEKPMRSQSLGSISPASAQPSFMTPHRPIKTEPEETISEQMLSDTPMPDAMAAEEAISKKEKSRDRSRSRSRKKADTDSDSERPKRRSVKKKKKEGEVGTPAQEEPPSPVEGAAAEPTIPLSESKQEMIEILQEAKKISEAIRESEVILPAEEAMTPEVNKSPAATPGEEPVLPPPPQPPAMETPKTPQETEAPKTPQEVEVPKIEPRAPKTPEEAEAPKPKVEPLKFDTVGRRKSKVFETAEMFSRSPTIEKPAAPLPKKVIIPGVKVSDAKAAFERRNSVTNPTEKFSLASTVNLDKLVQSELNKDLTEKEQEEKSKKELAIKVIGNAIQGDNKASTLPRRRISKPELKPATPGTPKMEDFTTKSLRRLLSQQEGTRPEVQPDHKNPENARGSEKPPICQRRFSRTMSDTNRSVFENGIKEDEKSSIPKPQSKSSSIDRVKKYLEELDRDLEENSETAAKLAAPESFLRSRRPRSIYSPQVYSQLSDFDKYLDFKRNSMLDNRFSRNPPNGFRRGNSVPLEEFTEIREPPRDEDKSRLERFLSVDRDREPSPRQEKSPEEKKTRRISRFLRPDFFDTPRELSAHVKENQNKIWSKPPNEITSEYTFPIPKKKEEILSPGPNQLKNPLLVEENPKAQPSFLESMSGNRVSKNSAIIEEKKEPPPIAKLISVLEKPQSKTTLEPISVTTKANEIPAFLKNVDEKPKAQPPSKLISSLDKPQSKTSLEPMSATTKANEIATTSKVIQRNSLLVDENSRAEPPSFNSMQIPGSGKSPKTKEISAVLKAFDEKPPSKLIASLEKPQSRSGKDILEPLSTSTKTNETSSTSKVTQRNSLVDEKAKLFSGLEKPPSRICATTKVDEITTKVVDLPPSPMKLEKFQNQITAEQPLPADSKVSQRNPVEENQKPHGSLKLEKLQSGMSIQEPISTNSNVVKQNPIIVDTKEGSGSLIGSKPESLKETKPSSKDSGETTSSQTPESKVTKKVLEVSKQNSLTKINKETESPLVDTKLTSNLPSAAESIASKKEIGLNSPKNTEIPPASEIKLENSPSRIKKEIAEPHSSKTLTTKENENSSLSSSEIKTSKKSTDPKRRSLIKTTKSSSENIEPSATSNENENSDSKTVKQKSLIKTNKGSSENLELASNESSSLITERKIIKKSSESKLDGSKRKSLIKMNDSSENLVSASENESSSLTAESKIVKKSSESKLDASKRKSLLKTNDSSENLESASTSNENNSSVPTPESKIVKSSESKLVDASKRKSLIKSKDNSLENLGSASTSNENISSVAVAESKNVKKSSESKLVDASKRKSLLKTNDSLENLESASTSNDNISSVPTSESKIVKKSSESKLVDASKRKSLIKSKDNSLENLESASTSHENISSIPVTENKIVKKSSESKLVDATKRKSLIKSKDSSLENLESAGSSNENNISVPTPETKIVKKSLESKLVDVSKRKSLIKSKDNSLENLESTSTSNENISSIPKTESKIVKKSSESKLVDVSKRSSLIKSKDNSLENLGSANASNDNEVTTNLPSERKVVKKSSESKLVVKTNDKSLEKSEISPNSTVNSTLPSESNIATKSSESKLIDASKRSSLIKSNDSSLENLQSKDNETTSESKITKKSSDASQRRSLIKTNEGSSEKLGSAVSIDTENPTFTSESKILKKSTEASKRRSLLKVNKSSENLNVTSQQNSSEPQPLKDIIKASSIDNGSFENLEIAEPPVLDNLASSPIKKSVEFAEPIAEKCGAKAKTVKLAKEKKGLSKIVADTKDLFRMNGEKKSKSKTSKVAPTEGEELFKLCKEGKEAKPKVSRIEKAVKLLRRNSIGQSDEFSESKLLKRAVSLEELNPLPKPPQLPQQVPDPTNDQDEAVSTHTENSDNTWSSGAEYSDARQEQEECVSDRIRRKSFYTRFQPSATSSSLSRPSRVYSRSHSTSTSLSDRKRYF